ncbi:hypothetical protein Tco_1434417, partial [Tanacetum coccineum]
KLVPKPIGTGGCGNSANNQNESPLCIPSNKNVLPYLLGKPLVRMKRDVEYVANNNIAPQSLSGTGQCIPLNTCEDVVGQQIVGSGMLVAQNAYVYQAADVELLQGNVQQLKCPLGINEVPSDINVDIPHVQTCLDSASQNSVPLSNPQAPQEFTRSIPQTDNQNTSSPLPSNYKSVGRCEHRCEYCGALFWYDERLKSIGTNRRPKYGRCCKGGAHIDESVNNGRGPRGAANILTVVYFYDTDNEVDNRMSHFGGQNSDLRRDIVEGLIDMLDTHNSLVHLFRTAREKLADTHIPNFKVRLYNVVGAREYELPTSDMLGAIVYEPGPETDMDYDIIIEERS